MTKTMEYDVPCSVRLSQEFRNKLEDERRKEFFPSLGSYINKILLKRKITSEDLSEYCPPSGVPFSIRLVHGLRKELEHEQSQTKCRSLNAYIVWQLENRGM